MELIGNPIQKFRGNGDEGGGVPITRINEPFERCRKNKALGEGKSNIVVPAYRNCHTVTCYNHPESSAVIRLFGCDGPTV
jgi:hypothetical protein